MPTFRYRAASRTSYALAVLELIEYAYRSGAEFDFGPLVLEALLDQGLLVSGSDLEEARAILEKIPGLHLSDE